MKQVAELKWSAKLIILDIMDEKNLTMTSVSDFYTLTSYSILRMRIQRETAYYGN